ncbi:MAG: restriction endonuclease [Planctomycetes bacterium]|nr:restriction endonuclease [Planctomycetota bacterium]
MFPLWNIVIPILVGIVLIVLFGALPRPHRRAGTDPGPASGELELLDAYNYEEFEALARDLLRGLGLSVEVVAPGDEGVLELTASNEAPVVGGRYEVLCLFRRGGRPVEAAEIRPMTESLRDHDRLKGIVLSTAGFRPEARLVARENMELIDGVALVGLVRRHAPGRTRPGAA